MQLRTPMSQQPANLHSDWSRTLHGFEHGAESPVVGGSGRSKFVPVGARIGKGGQVFQTNLGAGLGDLVVKRFTWGAELPEQVVLDFTREATTVANLRHPHIAQVVDAGTLGDGTPFVVMERLSGMTLEEAARSGPLPAAEILPILRGVASALSAAHAAGIAHGQVRADNVFIAQAGVPARPCPKLLDFGVARLVTGGRAIGLRGDDALSGAPARTDLELGGRAGERADQLALATLACRIVGGMVTPAVYQTLFRAMNPDPSRRFGTIMAFIEALEDAFVNDAAGGSPKNAAEVTTLLGTVIPGSASRPVSVGAQIRVAAARPSSNAPTAALASAPSSLTQQFFAEGEQLDNAHAAGQAGQAETNVDEGNLAPRARVPRSRPQMILAALLALGSVAVIAGTAVSLANTSASESPTAQISPRAAVARPEATEAPLVQVPARARERARETAVAVGRGSRMRSLSPAPAKAPATPAGSARPAAVEPPAPPPPPALPAEAATAATDRSPPEVTPAAPSNEGVAQPGDEPRTAPSQELPTPSEPAESAPAPRGPDKEPPTSAPESPAPAERV
ncbi:MAG TPA: protein kinase [Polyangia bacterium]|nr:protein kinase [Polyangia bacterium]